MNLQFYKQKNKLYSFFDIHYYRLFLSLLSFFFFVRILYFSLTPDCHEDLDSLILGSLVFGLVFLAFSFDVVEIDLYKKTVQKKSFFTLYKQILEFKNKDVNFFTVRQTIYGIYVGFDVGIDIDYKRMVLTRFFKSKKIDHFINETMHLLEK